MKRQCCGDRPAEETDNLNGPLVELMIGCGGTEDQATGEQSKTMGAPRGAAACHA
jgi:hypothetical protein